MHAILSYILCSPQVHPAGVNTSNLAIGNGILLTVLFPEGPLSEVPLYTKIVWTNKYIIPQQ